MATTIPKTMIGFLKMLSDISKIEDLPTAQDIGKFTEEERMIFRYCQKHLKTNLDWMQEHLDYRESKIIVHEKRD